MKNLINTLLLIAIVLFGANNLFAQEECPQVYYTVYTKEAFEKYGDYGVQGLKVNPPSAKEVTLLFLLEQLDCEIPKGGIILVDQYGRKIFRPGNLDGKLVVEGGDYKGDVFYPKFTTVGSFIELTPFFQVNPNPSCAGSSFGGFLASGVPGDRLNIALRPSPSA